MMTHDDVIDAKASWQRDYNKLIILTEKTSWKSSFYLIFCNNRLILKSKEIFFGMILKYFIYAFIYK